MARRGSRAIIPILDKPYYFAKTVDGLFPVVVTAVMEGVRTPVFGSTIVYADIEFEPLLTTKTY